MTSPDNISDYERTERRIEEMRRLAKSIAERTRRIHGEVPADDDRPPPDPKTPDPKK